MPTEERSEKCNIADFEDGGKRPQAKEYGWCLETGKGTHSPNDTLILGQ